MKEIFNTLGLIAAVIMPLFNIPLIHKIISRKSSKDISLSWALGVWICLVIMAPSSFTSKDLTWRVFSYINFALFSVVTFVVVRFHKQ